ncbi:hypothetical protein POSPLADRAFT_1041504 [Postia placenta MAD-698-R-SB12]|uniref:Uncharacterized protein n=1 Tax=Postia placenta MAD-698-R-SB12 TaxID=670580 RepID=A0A1X6MNK8_9APHY|nr:hypothetical protein POSPLADRAFT_1041504 [Postia placenta MAD-698-R-SB12]OSX58014.1 hypothetical protein POSPLADRAFT_1041504 [Postia placenta MAD-698-R-SB12]
MGTLLRLAASENADYDVLLHVLYNSLGLTTSSCTELLSVCSYIHFSHLSGTQYAKPSMSAFSQRQADLSRSA